MSERERFEAWAKPDGYDVYRPNGTYYSSAETRDAWQAWQAAVAAERKRIVKALNQKQEAVYQDAESDEDLVAAAIYNLALDWAIQQITEESEMTQQDARRYMQNQPEQKVAYDKDGNPVGTVITWPSGNVSVGPPPERKVPQPLTEDDLKFDGYGDWVVKGSRILKSNGLGIYKIADIEEACRK